MAAVGTQITKHSAVFTAAMAGSGLHLAWLFFFPNSRTGGFATPKLWDLGQFGTFYNALIASVSSSLK